MKMLCAFFAFVLIFEVLNASPIEVDNAGSAIVLSRVRRVTCDLLSVSTPWGSVNHAACAAHCLSMNAGYRGGSCNNGVCHCRR